MTEWRDLPTDGVLEATIDLPPFSAYKTFTYQSKKNQDEKRILFWRERESKRVRDMIKSHVVVVLCEFENE